MNRLEQIANVIDLVQDLLTCELGNAARHNLHESLNALQQAAIALDQVLTAIEQINEHGASESALLRSDSVRRLRGQPS
jgi:hypothetical protein